MSLAGVRIAILVSPLYLFTTLSITIDFKDKPVEVADENLIVVNNI
jgi:hypothetical protein